MHVKHVLDTSIIQMRVSQGIPGYHTSSTSGVGTANHLIHVILWLYVLNISMITGLSHKVFALNKLDTSTSISQGLSSHSQY